MAAVRAPAACGVGTWQSCAGNPAVDSASFTSESGTTHVAAEVMLLLDGKVRGTRGWGPDPSMLCRSSSANSMVMSEESPFARLPEAGSPATGRAGMNAPGWLRGGAIAAADAGRSPTAFVRAASRMLSKLGCCWERGGGTACGGMGEGTAE